MSHPKKAFLTDVFLILSTFGSYLLIPFLLLLGRYRLWKGQELNDHLRERYGYSDIQAPDRLIWVHGASVGEVLSSLPLISKLLEQHPQLHILITSNTVQSHKILAQRLPEHCFHQFVPYDTALWVGRFLDHWRPQLFIGLESDLWPNRINQIKKRGIPQILLNACMSPQSAKSWGYFYSVIRGIWSQFKHVYVQSPTNVERLKSLGLTKIDGVGNLKYEINPLPYDIREQEKLAQQIGSRPVWAAISTHKGEESFVFKVHKRLKRKFPNILTIIAMRHPERMEYLAKDMHQENLSYITRSSHQPIGDQHDIFCFDTMGELGLIFELTKTIFIGGSLVPIGGHNPVEPAVHKCSMIVGPYIFKSQDVYKDFEESIHHIKDEDDLFESVLDMIKNPDKQKNIGDKSYNIVKEKSLNLDTIIQTINKYI